MKPIAKALGLDWSGQLGLIKNDVVLSSAMDVTSMVADDGKMRETVCLPLEYLNGWLFNGYGSIMSCNTLIINMLLSRYLRTATGYYVIPWQCMISEECTPNNSKEIARMKNEGGVRAAEVEIRITGTKQAFNTWTMAVATIDGENYEIQMVRFDEPSQYGIRSGRISKLYVANSDRKALANNDRGWDKESGLITRLPRNLLS